MGLSSFLAWDVDPFLRPDAPGLFRCYVKAGTMGSPPVGPLHFEA